MNFSRVPASYHSSCRKPDFALISLKKECGVIKCWNCELSWGQAVFTDAEYHCVSLWAIKILCYPPVSLLWLLQMLLCTIWEIWSYGETIPLQRCLSILLIWHGTHCVSHLKCVHRSHACSWIICSVKFLAQALAQKWAHLACRKRSIVVYWMRGLKKLHYVLM